MVRSRSRRHLLITVSVLLTALGMTACDPAATTTPDSGYGPAERVSAGSLHGRTAADLVLWDAASRVDVRLADLPGLLYRISTPAGSGLAPDVSGGDGRVRVRLRPTGDDGPDTVTILLNRAVRWDIRLPAGAGEQRLDLSAGAVTRLDLGSSGLLTVDLPRPVGTVPVTLREGAGTVAVSAPRAAPVRVRLFGGAGAVDTPWLSTNGEPPGAVLADPRWPAVADRYTVYARGGLGSFTLR